MIDELGHAAPFDDRYPATNERCAEVSAVTRSRAVGGSMLLWMSRPGEALLCGLAGGA